MRGRQKRAEPARKRIVRMLELGTEPHELERCLHESRKPLIAAGAKADNLPKGLGQQAEFVENLPLKAEELVCSWFKENSDFSSCADAVSSAERLFAEPECSDRNVWRSILRAFVLRECPPSVALWLSGAEAPSNQSAAKSQDFADSGVTPEAAELLMSVAAGKGLDGLQTPIPMLLAGAIAAAKGDTKSAEGWMAKLGAHHDPAGPKLANAVAAVLRLSSPAVEPTRAKLLSSEMAPEIDHLPFIGIVKKILPTGQLFVSVAALKVDDIFYEVSPSLARQIFPETGDATVFPTVVHKQFSEGEIGLWTAVRRGPDHATRCVVERSLPRPFLPVRVPHPSSDPDAVRDWMLHVYTPTPLHQPLFLLADGLAVRLPSGHHDPSRIDFDTPLDGYRGVEWIELVDAGVSFVADLPPEIEKLDCAPPATLVKRLFKRVKESEAVPSLTKSEIQAIAELAGANQDTLKSQVARALLGLRGATDAKVLLQEAGEELLAIPAVQEIVEAEKRRVAEALTAQVQQAKESLNYVAKRKQVLEDELEQLRNTIRQETDERKKAAKRQEADLVRRLRSAFEKASQEGAETLAQVAVVRALLQPVASNEPAGNEANPTDSTITSVPHTATDLAAGPVIDSVRGLRRTVEACSSFSGVNELLLACAVAAARTSPVIGITGGGASVLVRAMADVLAGGLLYRASVAQDMFNTGDLMRSPAVAQQAGRAWAVTVGDCLTAAAADEVPAVIELRGANRAPLEALLPELLDCGPGTAGISWLDASGVLRHAASGYPVIWILTFADGKTVFPIPEGLAASTPLMSTDGWPIEPKELEPAFVATAISQKCWMEFGSPEGYMQPDLEASVSQLSVAAQELGVDSASAAVMGRLALSAGRHAQAEAVAVAKERGGVVAAYAEDLQNRAGALQKLFGNEGA